MGKCTIAVLCLFVGLAVRSQSLVVKGNDRGISYLAYGNTELVNVDRSIGAQMIAEGHQVIHKGGKREYLWSYQGPIKRKSNSEWLFNFSFGDVNCVYTQVKDTLFITSTIINTSKDDTLCGVNLVPLQVGFPVRPAGFQKFFPYYHYNLDGPSIVSADFGSGKMVLSNEDVSNVVFTGLLDVNYPTVMYKVWCSNVPFNGMATAGVPNIEVRLAPGKSITYKLALRFYKPGFTGKEMAASVVAKYRSVNQVKFTWKDRRPLGMLMLSSVANQNPAANPRGFMPNQSVSIRSAAGLKQLRQQVLDYAKVSIGILKDMNAQGMITWDIEGQEFPHAISYVGSPDQVKKVAPEMDAIADEYFGMFRKAGFKTGLCIRPQEFVLAKDGKSAQQVDVKDPAAVLIRKIRYAKQRWGCTIFYVDSNVEPSTALMPASVFKKVHEAVPDVLLIPEHQDIKYYEYTAPFEEMRFGGRGLEAGTKDAYPSAFQVITNSEAIFDGNGKQLLPDEVLKSIIRQGNIILFRAWFYDQPTNKNLKEMYDQVQREKR